MVSRVRAKSDVRFARRTRADEEALARLLPLWPEDLLDTSLEGQRALVAKLERALMAERRRARAGSHAYDLARHCQLARAHRRERERLRDIAQAR